MELNAKNGGGSMIKAHDDATVCPCRHDKVFRDGVIFHGQAVIPGGPEIGRNSLEQGAVIVAHVRGFAVHELVGVSHRCPEGFGNGLVPETHT